MGSLEDRTVDVGWSIYSLGYLINYLMGNQDDGAVNSMYNLADFTNKRASSFGYLLGHLLGSLDDSTVNSVYDLADFPQQKRLFTWLLVRVFVGQPG